jgi:hypothetical protein
MSGHNDEVRVSFGSFSQYRVGRGSGLADESRDRQLARAKLMSDIGQGFPGGPRRGTGAHHLRRHHLKQDHCRSGGSRDGPR